MTLLVEEEFALKAVAVPLAIAEVEFCNKAKTVANKEVLK